MLHACAHEAFVFWRRVRLLQRHPLSGGAFFVAAADSTTRCRRDPSLGAQPGVALRLGRKTSPSTNSLNPLNCFYFKQCFSGNVYVSTRFRYKCSYNRRFCVQNSLQKTTDRDSPRSSTRIENPGQSAQQEAAPLTCTRMDLARTSFYRLV